MVHNQVATLDQTVDQQTIYIGVRTQLNPSFNEGVPLVAPTTFGSGVDQSPDNHLSATNNNVIRSMKTKFKLTKQRRLIKEATWKNGGEHIMFATKNVNKEIEAGANDKGFYVDTFQGNHGFSYTMGSGYQWDAVKNDPE